MFKYFDNTFFKFLFGFLTILAVSFIFIFLTQVWSEGENFENTYVEVSRD
jgi:hypothetical protein